MNMATELKHISLISDSMFSTALSLLFPDAWSIFLFNRVCVCVFCAVVSQRPEATRRVLWVFYYTYFLYFSLLSLCPTVLLDFSLPDCSSVHFRILAYRCHYRLQLCNWWFFRLSHYTAPLLNVRHKGGPYGRQPDPMKRGGLQSIILKS